MCWLLCYKRGYKLGNRNQQWAETKKIHPPGHGICHFFAYDCRGSHIPKNSCPVVAGSVTRVVVLTALFSVVRGNSWWFWDGETPSSVLPVNNGSSMLTWAPPAPQQSAWHTVKDSIDFSHYYQHLPGAPQMYSSSCAWDPNFIPAALMSSQQDP